MLSRLRYTVREMWASLSRNLTLTVAAIITSAVSLLLFGLALLLQHAFDNQLQQWSGGVEMIVYMNNGASADQIALVQKSLVDNSTLIAKVDYCDIACSVTNAKRLFGGDSDALSQLGPDKIPSFFRVVPVEADNTGVLTQLSSSIKTLPAVFTVAFPNKEIDTLRALKGFFGPRTLIIAVALLAAAALLIWNTIRTAMFARRREIEVMKLVGATNWFIRLPFMLEGLLQGVAGGALASGGLLFLNGDWTRGVRSLPTGSGFESLVVLGGYPWHVVLYMLVLGAFVGAAGSGTAASRFLDV
jgi:cell division transport system permease protein